MGLTQSFALILFLLIVLASLWLFIPSKKEREEKKARLKRLEDETITIPETGEVLSFDQIQASNYMEPDEIDIISEARGIAKDHLQFYIDFMNENGFKRKDFTQKEINHLNDLYILYDFDEFYFSDCYSNSALGISLVNDEDSDLMGILCQFEISEWYPHTFKLPKNLECLINLEYEQDKVKEENGYEYFVLDDLGTEIFQNQFIHTLSKIEHTTFEIKDSKVFFFLKIEHGKDALDKIHIISKSIKR
jgi:cbb3-type cytochrome oxidase subunit 3